jgi:hypothetical protein
MDKRRADEVQGGSPLAGPDYLSLVIEWQPPSTIETPVDGESEQRVTATHDQISEWDLVDEAGIESFPASDPPAWGSSHAMATEQEPPNSEAAHPLRRFSRAFKSLTLGAVGALALGSIAVWIRRFRRAHARGWAMSR